MTLTANDLCQHDGLDWGKRNQSDRRDKGAGGSEEQDQTIAKTSINTPPSSPKVLSVNASSKRRSNEREIAKKEQTVLTVGRLLVLTARYLLRDLLVYPQCRFLFRFLCLNHPPREDPVSDSVRRWSARAINVRMHWVYALFGPAKIEIS